MNGAIGRLGRRRIAAPVIEYADLSRVRRTRRFELRAVSSSLPARRSRLMTTIAPDLSRRTRFLICISLPLVMAFVSVGHAQSIEARRAEIQRIWQVDLSLSDTSDALFYVDRVEFLVSTLDNGAARSSGLLLLGKLYSHLNDDQNSMDAYREAVATAPSARIKQSALRGMRRTNEKFGRLDEAIALSRSLTESMESTIDWDAYAERRHASIWRDEVSWLAEQFERKGDLIAAAAQYRRITDREKTPRLRWSLLRRRAKLLKRAGQPEKASALFQESYDALTQMPDRPVNSFFLAIEAELLRGKYDDVVTREFLAESNDLVERYRGCGSCTLIHEFNIAMNTLTGGLPDLSESEWYDALDRLTVVIERVESGESPGNGVDTRELLKTAYMTAIDEIAYKSIAPDDLSLYLLQRMDTAFPNAPDSRIFIRQAIAALDKRFSDATWQAYPALEALREREFNDSTVDDTSKADGQVGRADVAPGRDLPTLQSASIEEVSTQPQRRTRLDPGEAIPPHPVDTDHTAVALARHADSFDSSHVGIDSANSHLQQASSATKRSDEKTSGRNALRSTAVTLAVARSEYRKPQSPSHSERRRFIRDQRIRKAPASPSARRRKIRSNQIADSDFDHDTSTASPADTEWFGWLSGAGLIGIALAAGLKWSQSRSRPQGRR